MGQALLNRAASRFVLATAVAVFAALLLAGSAAAATITVTTTSEATGVDGGCSLREAVEAANTNVAVNECPAGDPGPTIDVIEFNIAPLDGTVKTISLTSGLPNLTGPVNINGFTQNGATPNTNPIASGSNAQLKIELEGSGSPAGTAGFRINATNVTIQGLVINRFPADGVFVNGASNLTITGNYVGLDPTGSIARGNGGNGIQVAFTPNATIGGTTAAARNVVSANTGIGIFVSGGPSTNAVIQGNIVGLNAAGTADFGNTESGIVVSGTTGALVGGTAAGSANVSSGNDDSGMQIETTADGTLVYGNFFGTNAAGTSAIGNNDAGIGTLGTSANSRIGGIGAGEGNVIANTANAAGVRVQAGTGHSIRGNRIFSNSGRGIALTSTRAANDDQDPDTGANNLQNFPTLASAGVSAGSTRFAGSLNSTPSRTFAIDIYSNSACDSVGSGEGETYVDSTNVTTNGSGDAGFVFSVAGGSIWTVYTATATDTVTGDTSEFSTCTTSVAPGVTVTQSGGTTNVVEGGATDSFTVVLTSQPTSNVTVTLTPNAQVTVSPTGPLTFTDTNWSTPQTVTVAAVNDAVAEGAHSGSVSFGISSADPQYTGVTAANVSVSITDNDTAGITVSESGGSTSVTEGGATDSFTVVLTSQPTSNVNVTLTPDAQVTISPPGPLTFTDSNWSTPQTVTVTAVDDAVSEGTHSGAVSFSVSSSDPNYNNRAVPGVSVAITDNETATLSVNDVSLTEGDSGTSTMTFTVTLAPQSAQTVTVQYATSDVTATGQASCATAGADYQPASGTLTFAPTVTTQTFAVLICGDTLSESDETFQATLSNPTNATIGAGTGIGTIQNDDSGGTVQFSTAAAQVSEQAGTLTVTVQRGGGAASGVTVQYATSNGSATDGQDYTATSGTLTFGTGEMTKTFTVPIVADAVDEPTETFTVTLANVTGGATLGSPATQTVTIADVDLTPCQTTLSADVPVGSTTLPVVSQSGCQVNDHIAINRGGSTEERAIITGFGSIIIDQPTQRAHRAGEVVVKIGVSEDLGRAVVPPEDDSDKPVKETEEERQQRQRTNRSNRDDYALEGDVLEVRCGEPIPTVMVANRDGTVAVQLLGEAAKACGSIRVGDYLEADGEKQHELLFEASDVNVRRRR